MSSTRRRLLGDVSSFQLAAGALAAMTSAWIASTLGVAGTIIGAAVGSLVLTTTSAFYSRTLETGRTLIVQTSDGSSVETQAEPGGTQEALAAVEEATGSPVQGAEFVDDGEEDTSSRDWRTLPWRRIAISTVAALVIAFAAMSAYEAVTGRAFGSDPDATRITTPFSGGGSSSQQQTPGDDGDGGDRAPADPDAPQDDDEDGGDENTPQTPVEPSAPAPAPTTPAPAPAPPAPPADQ